MPDACAPPTTAEKNGGRRSKMKNQRNTLRKVNYTLVKVDATTPCGDL